MSEAKTSMAGWTPILVLPNLDIRGIIDCDIAALVPVTDGRVEALRAQHPRFHDFLSRFQGQFGEQIWPSVILFRSHAPRSYYTPEALQGFRDLCALSVVPYARADRLIYERASPLAHSNIFAFYPWMVDKKFESMLCVNPAMLATHLVEEFKGQSFPEHGHTSLMERALDEPLIKCLLDCWITRFADTEPDWQGLALFRSLNMANQAAQVPAHAAASIYDVGRSIALWVSALEILARPEGGKVDYVVVSDLIARARWSCSKFTDIVHPVTFRGGTSNRVFTSWLYHHIYQLRNDFLHGNRIEASKMTIGAKGNPVIDIAACLYRMALAALLDINYMDPHPENTDNSYMAYLVSERRRFNDFQRKFERALLMALR